MTADMVQGDGYCLYHADCLDVLPTLEAQSVDCVCADPPYGTTACRWDSVIPFAPMWDGIKHVIKPRAAVVLFGSQPFTSALVMSNAEWFRYTWVWEKNNGTDFLNVNRKPFKVDEDIIIFYQQQPTYNPQLETGEPYHAVSGTAHRSGLRQPDIADGTITINLGWRYPRTVIRFDVEKGIHPTQKPVTLLKYLIRTYTNEGDTVLDFTMGSGTTGVAALLTGRRFIGIELDTGYFQIACDRIADAARTVRGEWKPLQDTQMHNDLPLFQNGDPHG